jgi:hypothetical protein
MSKLRTHLDGFNQFGLFFKKNTKSQSRRNYMVYGMVNKMKEDRTWTTQFAVRFGNYKFYNYKFQTVTDECEEGFYNNRIKNKYIKDLGKEAWYRMLFDISNEKISDKPRNHFESGKCLLKFENLSTKILSFCRFFS